MTFFLIAMLVQLAAAVWLVMRGRKIGMFFGLVALSALVSVAMKTPVNFDRSELFVSAKQTTKLHPNGK